MFLQATGLPHTILNYLTYQDIRLNEEAVTRPDKVVTAVYEENVLIEDLLNNLKATTPFWLLVGSRYSLLTSKAIQDFMIQ
jgi:hypothetical protein